MIDIGVVGQGIVGTAVAQGMKHAFHVETYDKFKSEESTCGSIAELFEKVDGPIFICVPTPMKRDGSADTSIVESVIAELNEAVDRIIGEPAEHAPIVIKSTIPPGTTERFNAKYRNLRVVFNPEFLTEANAIEDFKNQKRIIIGGPHSAATLIKRIYQISYPQVPTTKTSSTIAEMVKYATNCFLATKVALANEFYQICNALEIDFDKVVEYSTQDARLGQSHWAVPGPDGDVGFGMSCFPKDLNALIARAKELGVEPKVMMGAWSKNLEVRKNRDWEKMPGRAVS